MFAEKFLLFLKTYHSSNQVAFGQGDFWAEGFLEERLLLLLLLCCEAFETGGLLGCGAFYLGSFWLGDFW